MFPLRRLFMAVVNAKKSQKIQPSDTASIQFRCMPWDLDMYAEMNNGRVLTLYDLGRMNFAIRTGLDRVLQKNKWGLVVAGSTVRYRKRVRGFDKVTMYTRIADNDERWVYMEQSMWVNGEPCSHVLLRTGVTEKGKVVATERVIEALGLSKMDFSSLSSIDWTETWIDCDNQRPWPPFGG